MTTPLDWIRDASTTLPQPAGQAVDSAVDVAEGIIFADGSLPAGVNPADIYSWFHDGPGTPGYERARDVLGTLGSRFPDYTTEIRAARDEVAAGWIGLAAEQSVRSFQPLLDASAKLERHATNAEHAVSGQITSFNDTKNRVVPVPAQPPSGPGMNQFTQPFAPDNLTADAAVAGYQLATYNNQDAYGGYQGQTTPQGRTLPQDQADSATTRRRNSDDGDTGTRPPVDGQRPPVTPPPTPRPPVPGPPVGNPPDDRQPAETQPSPGTQQQQRGLTDPSQVATSTPTAATPTGRIPGPAPSPAAGHGSPGPVPTPSAFPSGTRPPATVRAGGFGGSAGGFGGRPGGSAGADPGGRGVRRGPGGFSTAGPGSSGPDPNGRGGSGTSARQGGGSPGAGGHGGHGQGDEDREHTTKYVLKTERDSELIGDLPPHSPSVIEGIGRADD